jgi:AF2212-like protein
VPREQNREADELANRALDETSSTEVRKARREMPPAVSHNTPAAAQRGSQQRIRAKYSGGVLHPLDEVELSEGEIVELKVTRTGRH